MEATRCEAAADKRSEILLRKRKTMKTFRSFVKPCGVAAITAFTVAAFATVTVNAQDIGSPKGGAAKLVKPIVTSANVMNPKSDVTTEMACPKCKIVTATYTNIEKGHIKTTTLGQKDLCPTCEQKFVTVGVGKAKQNIVKHICKESGRMDGSCCVAKKDAASATGVN